MSDADLDNVTLLDTQGRFQIDVDYFAATAVNPDGSTWPILIRRELTDGYAPTSSTAWRIHGTAKHDLIDDLASDRVRIILDTIDSDIAQAAQRTASTPRRLIAAALHRTANRLSRSHAHAGGDS